MWQQYMKGNVSISGEGIPSPYPNLCERCKEKEAVNDVITIIDFYNSELGRIKGMYLCSRCTFLEKFRQTSEGIVREFKCKKI